MNELQIRLSADITALQSALTKAKNTIKSFESETEKESEKGNVGFKRKIGLIEQLTNKAKALRTALSQATNETQVAKYNAQLEETSRELTRLNALGRSVTANLGSTAGGFGKLAQTSGGANAAVQEFGRVIQDAPFAMNNFGSVANNLTRVMELYTFEVKNAGSASKAFSNIAGAVVNPMNLALLAVSAVASAFTLYSMGAFDFLKSTEEATDGIEKYNEEIQKTIDSLSAFEKVSLNTANSVEKEKIEIDSLFSILRDTNLSQETRIGAYNKLISLYPNLLKGLTQEKALAGDLTNEYKLLTEAIGQKALAAALEGELIESFKEQFDIQKQLNSEKKEQKRIEDELLTVLIEEERQARLVRGANKDGLALRGQQLEVDRSRSQSLDEQLKKQQEIVRLTEKLITAQGTEAEQLKIQLLEVNKQVATLFGFGEKENPLKPLEETVNRAKEDLSQLNILLERASLLRRDAFFSGVEAPISVESGAATTQGIIIPDLGTEVFKEQAQEVIDTNRIITDSFSSLGTAIAANLNISNDAVKGFVSTVLSNAPKLIQAIIAQAQASNRAADIANQGNLKQATGNAIVTATAGAKALGPVGLAALPILIGGALALISSAFGKGGGGSASVGSASAGAPPQIFTNSQIPSIPGSSAPSPSGNIDFEREQGRITTTVSGEDIVFVYDRYQERKKGGG